MAATDDGDVMISNGDVVNERPLTATVLPLLVLPMVVWEILPTGNEISPFDPARCFGELETGLAGKNQIHISKKL